MEGLGLVFWGLGLLLFSGLPASLLPLGPTAGQRLTVSLLLTGSLLGILSTGWSWCGTEVSVLSLPWCLPWGSFTVAVAALSAFFLSLIFTIAALGSVYSLSYWKQLEHPENGKKLGIFYGLLAGSMALVVIARDGVLFLLVWEVMAVSAYFAATIEDDLLEVRQAGGFIWSPLMSAPCY